MSEMLNKCPCCKGEAEYCGYKFWWVQCKECELSTKTCETKEEAEKLWNTRKPMQNIVERLEEKKPYYVDDERACIERRCFNTAIEIVKEEGGMNV